MLQKTEPPRPARSKPRRFVSRTLWLLVLAVAAFGSWHWYQSLPHAGATKATAVPAPVPVDVATSIREGFPSTSTGSASPRRGIPSPYAPASMDRSTRSTSMKARPSGRRSSAQIDPRPFQASLDQALAKKTLDNSLLANSKRDLVRYTTVGTLAVTQQQIDTPTRARAAAGSADQTRSGRHR